MLNELKHTLINNCSSENLAKCSLAMRAHIDNHNQTMTLLCHGHSFIYFAKNYSKNPKKLIGTEMIFAEFHRHNDTNLTVLLYDAEDLVVLCRGDENRLEPYCGMTIAGFFKYLNTMPNPYPFAMTNKKMLNASPLGVELLTILSKGNCN